MMKKGNLSVNSENIFQIIQDNIYDEKDAFVREIISNGQDAIVKHQLLTKEDVSQDAYRIDVIIDEAEKTIKFVDNGVGMDAEEVDKYINHIAFSGAMDHVYQDGSSAERTPIIGHFGLGFYSVFMITENVTIDTLSYKEGAKPVHWACNGKTMEFALEEGTKKTRGTEVTLYLKENLQFTNGYNLLKSARKYCGFIETEIFITVENETVHESREPFGTQKVNYPNPIWCIPPEHLTEDDYINAYHQMFDQVRKPACWINLYNEDFGVKGIIYLRNLDNTGASLDGKMKLFSKRIFVAENVRELIPDFILVQNGVIDIEELPLNVSRASIKDDGYAAAIYTWIVEQLGLQLEAMFQNEREKYESIWPDIGPFIKLGFIKNRKFRPFARRCMIYETLEGKFISLLDYLSLLNTTKTIFYTSDVVQQAQYIMLFKESNIPVLKLLHMVDQPFIRLIEMEYQQEGLKFKRIDSELFDVLLAPADEEKLKTAEERLQQFFRKVIGNTELKISAKHLISQEISSLFIQDEQTRRMQDTLEVYGLSEGVDLSKYNFQDEILLLNTNNALIQRILKYPEYEVSEILAKQVYDLARLMLGRLDDMELVEFVNRTNYIMKQWD